MKFILSMFGGFKNLIATIAQIILAILTLPLLCIILRFLLPDKAGTFVLNILGEVPLFEVWLDMVAGFAGHADMAVNYTNYFEAVLAPVGETMGEAILIGMCIYLCKTLGTMLYVRGVPVLQTIIGVFLGCITLGAMGSGDIRYIIMASGFLIIVNIILTIFAASGQPVKKVLGIFLGLGLQSAVAGMASAYIAALTLILQGAVTQLTVMIGLIGMTVCPLLILLLIDYYFLTPKKQ